MITPYDYTKFMRPEPMPSWQQPQVSLVGRIVDTINETTPNDVPMNGGVGVFPLRDSSAIYIKRWLPNGTIETIRYIPDTTAPEPELTLDGLAARLNALEQEVRDGSTGVRTADDQVEPAGDERSQ